MKSAGHHPWLQQTLCHIFETFIFSPSVSIFMFYPLFRMEAFFIYKWLSKCHWHQQLLWTEKNLTQGEWFIPTSSSTRCIIIHHRHLNATFCFGSSHQETIQVFSIIIKLQYMGKDLDNYWRKQTLRGLHFEC